MTILLTKFVYYNHLNLDLSSSSGEVIPDCYKVTINMGSRLKNNKLVISLKNDPIDLFSGTTLRHQWVTFDGLPVFKAVKVSRGSIINEELINCYVKHETSDPTLDIESDDYLLFQGVINNAETPIDNTHNSIILNCKDRTSIILDKLSIPQSFNISDTSAPDGTGWSVPYILQNIIRNATDNDGSQVEKFNDSGAKKVTYKYLVDARLFSESILVSGTTTGSSTRKLIDSSKTFTSSVSIGDWVRNTSTNDYAYILSIDSDTQLTLTRDIISSGSSYQVSNGFIQDIRPDGSSFPYTHFAMINKPINEMVSSLASIEHTNSDSEINSSLIIKRSMRWFIDTKNRFHFFVPSDTPSLYFEVGKTVAVSPDTRSYKIYQIKPETFTADNINFIIYKAGEDMNGVQVKGYSRAQFSGSPNAKESLREFPRIARIMKWAEAQGGNITKNQFDDYNYPVSYNPLPSGDSYPIWDRIKSSIPTNDTTYNTSFIANAKKYADSICQSIFSRVSNPRWKGSFQVQGINIQVDELINITSKSHGIINLNVRVTQVTHSITSELGWLTTISYEEDEEEILKIS